MALCLGGVVALWTVWPAGVVQQQVLCLTAQTVRGISLAGCALWGTRVAHATLRKSSGKEAERGEGEDDVKYVLFDRGQLWNGGESEREVWHATKVPGLELSSVCCSYMTCTVTTRLQKCSIIDVLSWSVVMCKSRNEKKGRLPLTLHHTPSILEVKSIATVLALLGVLAYDTPFWAVFTLAGRLVGKCARWTTRRAGLSSGQKMTCGQKDKSYRWYNKWSTALPSYLTAS